MVRHLFWSVLIVVLSFASATAGPLDSHRVVIEEDLEMKALCEAAELSLPDTADERSSLFHRLTEKWTKLDDQGRHQEALECAIRAAMILKKDAGADASRAETFCKCARSFVGLRNYNQAENHYLLALHLGEKSYGAGHPRLIAIERGFADLKVVQGRFDRAQFLYERALPILKSAYGGESPQYVETLVRLASLHATRKDYSRAESKLIESLGIYKQLHGSKHTVTTNVAAALVTCANLRAKAERESQLR